MADKADLADAGQWERQKRQLEQICEELGLVWPSEVRRPAGSCSMVKPGQDLVIAGQIGLGGTVWMARHKADILRKTLPEDYVESGRALQADMERVSAFVTLNPVAGASALEIAADDAALEAAADVAAFGTVMGAAALEANRGVYGAAAVYHVLQGGIFGALWEFAQAAGTGIYARLKEIPVRQQTIEFCEVFDLNPYQLFSGGCFLMAADHGCDVLYRMNRAGIPCAVIGKITNDHDRVVAHDDTCRYLTRPRQDEIFKLL